MKSLRPEYLLYKPECSAESEIFALIIGHVPKKKVCVAHK